MSNQIFKRLVNLAFGISGFNFQMFAVYIELRPFNGILQFGHCTQLIFSGFVLLVTDDFLHSFWKLAYISLLYVLANLHSRFQRFIVRRVSQNHDCFVTFGFRHQTVICFFNGISSHGQETQTHTASCHTNRNAVHHLIESKVIFPITELLGCENITVNHLSNTLHDRSGIHIGIPDFTLNVLFLIGQEIISIASSANIVLAHQTVKASTDSFTHDNLIHTNIVRHKDNDIVQIRRNIINISNQVQKFQHIHILLFNAIHVVSSFLTTLNYSANRTVQESMYGIVKTEEWNKCVFILLLNFLCSFLETGKHRTLTTGQVLAGISMFPDFSKYFLHDDELIRHEWEVLCKFSRTGITFNIQNRTAKAEQVTKNRIILLINTFQIFGCFWLLFQDTLLDNFIHGGRR